VPCKGTTGLNGDAIQADHDIEPYKLHWTATVMLNSPPNPMWKLALHMLQTASDLDYAPSTITVLRVTLMMTKEGPEAVKYRSQFRSALNKLSHLVRAGKNPDALTLQGLLRVRGGNALKALKEFDAAIDAGRRAGDAYAPVPTKQRNTPGSSGGEDTTSKQRERQWMYEADCYVARGRILLQMGNREAALESFSVAAFELDSPDGYLELGKNLPPGSPPRDECLLKAAISGRPEACPLLSASETAKSQEAGSDKALVEEHLRWAAEWALLGKTIKEASEGTVNV
jgi:tetratricopeptide (TPR) repeat protein